MPRNTLPWFGLFFLALTTIPAVAQADLYDNGPGDGQDTAWTINFGFAVSDTFTLNTNATVNGLAFVAWMFPDETVVEGEVAITSSEFGGTSYFDNNVNFTQSSCFTNGGGFNVCTETAVFSNVNLTAGTYWLTLDNVITTAPDDPVYWDQNSGPSLASQSSVGTIPSESFTIIGGIGTGTSGTTPEPGSLMLFGTGCLAVVGALRRKLF